MVVGYGSLASARGLGRHARGVQDGWLVAVEGARRFAKPAQRRTCLAMDLEPGHAAALEGRRVAAADPPPAAGFEGLLLVYEAGETHDVARREGYPPRLWERLLERAGPRGLAAFLLELAEEAGGEPVAYRAALREASGPYELPVYHYVPHPVRTPEGPAVIFVAPEPGQTGDPARESCKASLPDYRPGLLDCVYQGARAAYALEEDDGVQAGYVEVCLLAAAHGTSVRDLKGAGVDPADPTGSLLASWRADPSPLERERQALRALIPSWREDHRHRERAGRDLDAALRRSGLLDL